MKWTENGAAECISRNFYEVAQTCVFCHAQTAMLYRDRDRWFAIPRLMLSSTVASGALALEYVKSPEIKGYSLLGLAAIGAINSLFGSIQMYLKYGELSGVHFQISEAWHSLARKIELCLKKDIADRPEVDHFLDGIGSDFSRLTESSPEIPTSVVYRFKWMFKDWIDAGRGVAHYLNGLHEIEMPKHREGEGDDVKENAVI